MTKAQAMQIAHNSICTQYGNLTQSANHNDELDTWWIAMNITKPGCYPGCVVYPNGSVNMSWACTGFIVPAEVIAKLARANDSIEGQALALCSTPNISGVYICGDYIRVDSPLLGNYTYPGPMIGSFFYKNGELVAQCRIVPLDSPEATCSFQDGAEAPCMSDWFFAASDSSQCSQLNFGNDCRMQDTVCPQITPENGSDSN